MEIVIKIPDDAYNILLEEQRIPTGLDYEYLIMHGTPLPKGHGRLIDVNDLLDDIGLEDCGYNRDVNMGEIITLENIDRIPTIIEADKERRNE